MLKIEDLKGVIPPIITPVDEDENVDEEGLKRVIDHVIDGGVHGVFVLGSNGEFYGLDFEKQNCQCFCIITRGKPTIIFRFH